MTDRLATALIEARRTGSLIKTADTPPPETLEQVYRVQAAVAKATGAAGGFKVGRARATRDPDLCADPQRLDLAEWRHGSERAIAPLRR